MCRERISLLLVGFCALIAAWPAFGASGPSDQLKEAQGLCEQKKYEQAEQIYLEILRSKPSNSIALEAQEKLAVLYIEWGKRSEAESAFQGLISDYSTLDGVSRAVTHVAEAWQKAGKDERACEIFRYVIEKWPGDEFAMWSQMRLVISQASLGNEAEAQSAFEVLKAQYVGQEHISRAVCIVGDHYRDLGQHKKACEVYQDVLGNWPQVEFALWARMGEAISSIKMGSLKAAQQSINKIKADYAKDKRIATAECLVADAYRNAGRYGEAVQLYEYIVQEHPDSEYDFWSHAGLAICQLRQNEKAKATAEIDAILNYSNGEDSRIPSGIRMVADEYRALQKHNEAFDLYGYIVENYSDSKEALWAQMNVAISKIKRSGGAKGDLEVQKLLEGAVDADFSDASDLSSAICWIGDEYRKLGKDKEACELYQHVLDHYPATEHAFWAQMNLGLSKIHLKDFDSADVAVQKVLTYSNVGDDRVAFAARTLGDEYRKAEKYDEAFSLYRHVVVQYGETQEAMWSQMNIAIAQIMFADPSANIETQKLLANYSNEPGIDSAMCWVADQYRKGGWYDDATNLYLRVLLEHPDSEYAMWSQVGIVTTHIVQGDQVAMQNAVVEFAKKFSNRDNFNLAVEELAKECRDQNQYDMSELVYKTVKDTLPNSTHRDGGIWWAVASITSDIAVGNDSEAELAVDSLIADFNDHPELAQGVLEIGLKYYRKGRLLLGTDNDKEVKNYYRKAINVWERIIYRLPRSAVTARACYVTAVCYSQELGEYITGIGYFQMIVNNWPDYQYAWHAQYFVGMYYSKLRNMGVLTAEKADPLIENAYKGVLEKYPESKSAVSAALNLATMSSSKGLLHDAANYYEIYLKKETNDNNLSKALKKVYGLGQRAEKEGAFSNAMELYGLVTVFARDIDDSLVSKARDRAAKSLEAIESSLILKKVQ